MADTDKKKWEKKSDRFEVRLPYSKKEAFLQACKLQGDTPSNAVRRFITSYIYRANLDSLKMARGAFKNIFKRNKRALLGVTAVFAVVIFGVQAINSNAPNEIVDTFSLFDKNNNGVLETGEIAINDEYLIRVLDVDRSSDVSRAELFLTGKMIYAVGDIKTYTELTAQTPILMEHTKTALQNMTNPILITFDLRNYENPKIDNFPLKQDMAKYDGHADRIVIRQSVNVKKKGSLFKITTEQLVLNGWDYRVDKTRAKKKSYSFSFHRFNP